MFRIIFLLTVLVSSAAFAEEETSRPQIESSQDADQLPTQYACGKCGGGPHLV